MRIGHFTAKGTADAVRQMEERLLDARGADKYGIALQLEVMRAYLPWLESMRDRRDVPYQEVMTDITLMSISSCVSIAAAMVSSQFPREAQVELGDKVAEVFKTMLLEALKNKLETEGKPGG